MITLDLSDLSHSELENAIAVHCAQFGTVSSVKIVPSAKHRKFSIAIVVMSNEAESEKVSTSIGDMQFGSSAVIQLMQKEGGPLLS